MVLARMVLVLHPYVSEVTGTVIVQVASVARCPVASVILFVPLSYVTGPPQVVEGAAVVMADQLMYP